jgi:hypothetical protein
MSWQRVPHGYDGADHVAPPLVVIRTTGLLQPLDADCQAMFSETIATTPGWNGSAALLGSVPDATRCSVA